MSEAEFELVMSPLCRSIEKDGRKVDVEIYQNGEGGWILEVVNEANSSIVWDEPFSSDEAALSEVENTIAKEGMASLQDS